MRVFAKPSNGEEFEVTDLYWFAENGVHDFKGEGDYERFTFRFDWQELAAALIEKWRSEEEGLIQEMCTNYRDEIARLDKRIALVKERIESGDLAAATDLVKGW